MRSQENQDFFFTNYFLLAANSKGECSKTFSSNLKYYTIQKEQSQFGFDVVFDRNVNCHSVYYVNAESPAEKAGIQVGKHIRDFIQQLNAFESSSYCIRLCAKGYDVSEASLSNYMFSSLSFPRYFVS